MVFGLVLSMICGGASARLGSRLGSYSSRGPMGLGSSYSAQKFPSSHALMLAMILMFTPMASGVACQTCKDTISGCTGGAACPLLKGPMDNAATLSGVGTGQAPDITKLMPSDLLCTFTKTCSGLMCIVGGVIGGQRVLPSLRAIGLGSR